MDMSVADQFLLSPGLISRGTEYGNKIALVKLSCNWNILDEKYYFKII